MRKKKVNETSSELPKFLTLPLSISLSEIIGREDDLSEVNKKIIAQDDLLLVNGIGGVGKTTLAKAFIQKYKDDYDHIICLSVTTSLKEALLTEAILIRNLKLGEEIRNLVRAKQQGEAYKLIVNELCNLNGKNLLLVDNAGINDAVEIEHLKSLIPAGCKLLLTSREHIAGCNEHHLDVLQPGKAKALFLEHYKREADEGDLKELLEYIGYHTLTIKLLAKTANLNPTLSVRDLIDNLKNRELGNKNLAIKIKASHSGKKEIEVYTHLLSVFDLTKLSEEENRLLFQLSLLPSKEILLDDLLLLFAIANENMSSFINLLSALVEKGYIIKDGDTYKVHMIIEEIVRYKTKPAFDDFKVLADSVSELLYVDQAKDNPVEKFPYIDYGTSLVSGIEWFEDSIDFGKEDIEIYNRLLGNVGSLLQDLGKYKQAAELLEKALKSDLKNYGEKHPSVAISQSNLAMVYQDLGRYEKAIKLLEKALAIFQNSLGENHPDTITVKRNLEYVINESKGK